MATDLVLLSLVYLLKQGRNVRVSADIAPGRCSIIVIRGHVITILLPLVGDGRGAERQRLSCGLESYLLRVGQRRACA